MLIKRPVLTLDGASSGNQQNVVMTMHILQAHIQKRVPLTDKEFSTCLSYFIPHKVRKRQFLHQEGEVCKNIAFVTNGCLRTYSVDGKGDEHVIQFAIEDWWVSDLYSFLSAKPSQYNIDALENSMALLIDRERRDKLLEAVPAMERFFRLLLEAHHVAVQRRINESLSASAEERYTAFLQTYPALVERVPQAQIASYLGVTPQSLSRIRKEMSVKK